MTLNASGPISLAGATAGQSIAVELGLSSTGQISLNCATVRTLAGVPSGAIVMPTNFYGKSNAFTYTVSANQTNFCMRAGAVTAGWNGTSNLIVNINSGVIISANSTGTRAMTITGAFPNGVTVNNSGTIVAQGGNGGNGGSGATAGSGAGGGTALYVRSPVTINNTPGTIAGGGGGGGGGGLGYLYCCPGGGGGGGGGGRTGLTNSGGGGGGSGGPPGGPGCCGTYSSAGGGGGSGGCIVGGGNGGSGGNWGASGGGGGDGGSGSAGGGGGGGSATCGSPTYITWSGNGTRYGSIS